MTNFSSQNVLSYAQRHSEKVGSFNQTIVGLSVSTTTILASASNPAGVIIRVMTLDPADNAGVAQRFMTKPGAAPSGYNDTAPLHLLAASGNTPNSFIGNIFLPAGYGIFYATTPGTATGDELASISYDILP